MGNCKGALPLESWAVFGGPWIEEVLSGNRELGRERLEPKELDLPITSSSNKSNPFRQYLISSCNVSNVFLMLCSSRQSLTCDLRGAKGNTEGLEPAPLPLRSDTDSLSDDYR
jgi:hypothetical protein